MRCIGGWRPRPVLACLPGDMSPVRVVAIEGGGPAGYGVHGPIYQLWSVVAASTHRASSRKTTPATILHGPPCCFSRLGQLCQLLRTLYRLHCSIHPLFFSSLSLLHPRKTQLCMSCLFDYCIQAQGMFPDHPPHPLPCFFCNLASVLFFPPCFRWPADTEKSWWQRLPGASITICSVSPLWEIVDIHLV
jgi:hypothetical protein